MRRGEGDAGGRRREGGEGDGGGRRREGREISCVAYRGFRLTYFADGECSCVDHVIGWRHSWLEFFFFSIGVRPSRSISLSSSVYVSVSLSVYLSPSFLFSLSVCLYLAI